MIRPLPRAALAALLALGLAAPAAAQGLLAQVDPAPPGRRGGDTLTIPGLPPIQLPPGSRVFTPNGPAAPGIDDHPAPPPRPARPQAGPSRPTPGASLGDEADRKREADKKRDTDLRKQAERVAPHSVPTNEEQRAKVLDALYTRLKAAEDADDAKGVAAAIERGMHPREWEAAKSMPEHDMDLATGHRPPQRPQPRVDLVYGESVEFRQA